mmetsp:Transcript_12567/g.27123  ORF Transcript_12567/g.27123 Transcript_12567/m.27123 type:complete len:896 (+) Transcript_12567:296-2983(+)|eukprot:CAMPEP_0202902544 /NCGR_PEP_ID=MMETSP1392-20130828/16914_1 /ASSEMBLY_ACC=CAM_ASM_000868 /TAXON_ID=225041 /ORGANISM="Chlamydomonas chlamydogama, Strain SAG 11-48b" /LENGTH=895 /DNA_ID=CAMNT_0049589323 /DNA_START=222 /DNA_END=2909 /DNA_ORIENTATION=+
MAEDPQALTLNWAFGTSTTVRNNIVNLSDGYSEKICYLAAHTAIIYDKRVRRQTFLQGHCNAISCITVTEDRSTIITADVGNESLLVLWNSKSGAPIRSIAKPHKHGILGMDISPDGAWLATVGAVDPQTGEQEIALWSMASIISEANVRPCVITAIPAGDTQLAVRFNMNNPNELISNGKRRVYFWMHQFPSSHRFKYYSPPLRAKDFKQSVGDFVMSTFVPGSTQALTATTDGDLVVWDEQGITAQMGTRATDRRAIKLMRIHSQAITFLSTIGDYIVSGGKDGFIRFYDPLLRIVAWFEDLAAGPILGVSFSSVLAEKVSNAELADTINRFMVPDFVVATEEAKILAVQSASFEEYEASRRKGTLVLEPMITDVVHVVAHPTCAEFAIVGSGGTLQRWDMVSHACVASRTFPKQTPTKIAYSRDGAFMVVGFEGGYINIVNTADLQDLHTARNTPAKITAVACSTTGEQVALADETHQVLLYAYMPYKHIMRWEYIGKSQAHHAPIVGLRFGESPAGQTRMFSLGADGRSVEYDLAGSSPNTGLRVLAHKDFPPSITPAAMAFAPPLQYYRHHSAETLLLLCDDAHKIRMYNPDAQQVVATFLGPTFAGPIQQLVMFKSASSTSAFLAYASAERVVGLLAWPMDGDPARTMGLIAHPGEVRAISISYDGRKLLTVGAEGSINMWDISTATLEAAGESSKVTGVQRWEQVVGDSALVNDLRDYFYYAQVKAQGEDAMAPRQISGTVPAAMVPDLMRAAGFYPSEADIANINNHIAFIAHSRDLDAMEAISFEDLLCLYVNHRPLTEVTQEDIVKAFIALGANPNNGRIGRDQLMSLLQTIGEPMDNQELLQALQALTGASKLSEVMPHSVDAQQFATDVLGFEDTAAAASATP